MSDAASSYDFCQPLGSSGAERVLRPEGCDDGTPEPTVNLVRLVKTIEGELVPRLMLAQRARAKAAQAAAKPARVVDADDVATFVQLLLSQHADVASSFVDTLVRRGASWQQSCLALMMPAARRLGELWEQDRCDFIQVTLALSKLHRVLHESVRRLDADFPLPLGHERPNSALISSTPGEQHTFGMLMVGHFFRRGGWDVRTELPSDHDDLVRVVQNAHFDLIGLSLGSEVNIPLLGRALRSIRRVSANKAVVLMVGGPVFVAKPHLVAEVGADATAADGEAAVRIGEEIRMARTALR